MKKYGNYTNEDLIALAAGGDNDAYEQLFENLKPITLHAAEMYRGKMVTYSTDDLLQEGNIVVWKIIAKGNFKSGSFTVTIIIRAIHKKDRIAKNNRHSGK